MKRERISKNKYFNILNLSITINSLFILHIDMAHQKPEYYTFPFSNTSIFIIRLQKSTK